MTTEVTPDAAEVDVATFNPFDPATMQCPFPHYAAMREELRVAASVDGLQARVRGLSMQALAETVLDISRGGLRRRARPGFGGMVPDERHFLTALEDTVEDGKTPADELLERYYGDWNEDLTRIYDEYSY